jgi:hypothetical protein
MPDSPNQPTEQPKTPTPIDGLPDLALEKAKMDYQAKIDGDKIACCVGARWKELVWDRVHSPKGVIPSLLLCPLLSTQVCAQAAALSNVFSRATTYEFADTYFGFFLSIGFLSCGTIATRTISG